MSKRVMSAEERRWQAESDVRSLMEAEVIKRDKARLKAAVNAAKSMAKKEEDEAKAVKKIAKMEPKKRVTKKRKK